MANYECGCGDNLGYDCKMSSCSRGNYSRKDDYSEMIPRTQESNYEFG